MVESKHIAAIAIAIIVMVTVIAVSWHFARGPEDRCFDACRGWNRAVDFVSATECRCAERE